ncbi:GtrA family protein [Pontibacter akesuensis]|uniref:Putative flippase GtrA (Transmembrane translocase of bactoprenol-linked glucose) n=2 Tax=Pontibacter akesuensis TaxID=388950 RepID=A0A1I7GI09_9BACT|nr:GtrA family protein [Pontibacter akesuensis]SFU48055.1 Putative flippase GtrA (transmembrane translocase of bactoprenol-linked glucose) [Pontibacter akesuensis]
MSITRKVQKNQVVRFIAVGAGCAAVEFMLFTLLVDFYNINYLAANLISLLVAVVLNYLISRKAVFESGKHTANVEFIIFVLFTGIGVGMNQFLVWYFVDQVLLDVRLGKVFAIGLVAIFNYFTKKHIVFKN